MLFPSAGGAHGYLPLVGVLSVVALAVGAGQLAAVLERARRTGRHDRVQLAFPRAWGMVAAGVLALFWVQETVEALLLGAGAAAPLAGRLVAGWPGRPAAAAPPGARSPDAATRPASPSARPSGRGAGAGASGAGGRR